jgi:3-dehydroquinate synthase
MGVVDASIGIKTAVNFIGKKNKLGTYCPPLAVFTDIAFLHTQDDRNLSNGSAEILKMACVKDSVLFELLEEHAASLMDARYQVSCCLVALCYWFAELLVQQLRVHHQLSLLCLLEVPAWFLS